MWDQVEQITFQYAWIADSSDADSDFDFYGNPLQ